MLENNRPSRQDVMTSLSIMFPEQAYQVAKDFLEWVDKSIQVGINKQWVVGETILPKLMVRHGTWDEHLQGAYTILQLFHQNMMREMDGMALCEIFDDGVYALMCAAWAATAYDDYKSMLNGGVDSMLQNREVNKVREESRAKIISILRSIENKSE